MLFFLPAFFLLLFMIIAPINRIIMEIIMFTKEKSITSLCLEYFVHDPQHFVSFYFIRLYVRRNKQEK